MKRILPAAWLVLLAGCASVPGMTVATAPATPMAPLEPMPTVRSSAATVTAVPILMDGRGLNPALEKAFQRAQADAAKAGITMTLNSGYRTPVEQERIFAERVKTYGSPEAAHRWALYPWESMHVRGLAIDVGPPSAAAWLWQRQETYGICRIYEHEPWHFELNRTGKPCGPLKKSETEG